MKQYGKGVMVIVMSVSVCLLAGTQERAAAMLAPVTMDQGHIPSTRDADLRTIQATLESKVLRARLHDLGLSDQEIQSRLSRLSDQEIHQLAMQIQAVHPAGDGGGFVFGVLILVLLVVLIIYLIKRI